MARMFARMWRRIGGWSMRAWSAAAEALDPQTVIVLGALAAIWYGVDQRRPAWWIVGACVYVPVVAVLLVLNFRSRRSG